MQFKKNIKAGKNRFSLFLIILIIYQLFSVVAKSENNLEGKNTDIKILDKISSKNELIKLMTSDDVDKTMNSVAILNPPEDPCESERYQATNKAIN